MHVLHWLPPIRVKIQIIKYMNENQIFKSIKHRYQLILRENQIKKIY